MKEGYHDCATPNCGTPAKDNFEYCYPCYNKKNIKNIITIHSNKNWLLKVIDSDNKEDWVNHVNSFTNQKGITMKAIQTHCNIVSNQVIYKPHYIAILLYKHVKKSL